MENLQHPPDPERDQKGNTPISLATPSSSENCPTGLSEKRHPMDLEAVKSSDESGCQSIQQPVTSAHQPWSGIARLSGRISSRQRRLLFHLVFAVCLLAWWISGIALKKTRHKWIVTTFWTWFLLVIIFFQWVPTKSVSKPIGNVFTNCISQPAMKVSRRIRYGFGWTALLALWLASAFGTPLSADTSYADRARSLAGVIVLQLGFWLASNNKKKIQWRTVIVGLITQQLLALFVLKTKAGYDLFDWIATAATDILNQGTKAAAFFFSTEVIQNHWFFVNTLSAIVFFIALVQLLYHFGVMQAVLVKFAWVFHKLMHVSGAEAVAAAASPFVGQAESVILIRPFVAHMTPAEMHQVMASGFATIAGSVLTAYVGMGMPAVYLISSSIMSVPAALGMSKLLFPEDGHPLTAGKVVIPEDGNVRTDHNALQAFSDGAWLGLRVAGMILANVLTVLALLYTVDGLLTWIGQFWAMDPNGSHPLTLELILQYIFYPISWLMGTPQQDVMKISRLLALKMISNEFVAYQELARLKPEMTERGILIGVYSLCGFANLGSLGIQIGVLNGLAPTKKDVISQVAVSALWCGFFTTIQTAAIAGMIT